VPLLPLATLANLANIDAAMRGRVARRVRGPSAFAVGGGPTLDFADATAFLARFEAMIEQVRRRRLQ